MIEKSSELGVVLLILILIQHYEEIYTFMVHIVQKIEPCIYEVLTRGLHSNSRFIV
jgi:hypothetical protein